MEGLELGQSTQVTGWRLVRRTHAKGIIGPDNWRYENLPFMQIGKKGIQEELLKGPVVVIGGGNEL